MEQIIWSDDLSVGVDEMDYQHKRLVGMINRLVDLASLTRTDQSVIKAAYLRVLSDMVQYATVHFDTEERYLKAIGYADFDNHVEEHKSFSRKAFELEQRWAGRPRHCRNQRVSAEMAVRPHPAYRHGLPQVQGM